MVLKLWVWCAVSVSKMVAVAQLWFRCYFLTDGFGDRIEATASIGSGMASFTTHYLFTAVGYFPLKHPDFQSVFLL